MFGGWGNSNIMPMGLGGLPNTAPRRPQKFKEYYRCFPVSMMAGPTREHLNWGGKIFLPPSALHKLTMLHVQYPMQFQLQNEDHGLTTYAGVLEFTAEEGRVYVPQWMMETLGGQPGSLLQITNVDLVQGTFVKIEPQIVEFLDISDPKAVLENVLRNFSTLSVGDIFKFEYNDRIYPIKVLEVKPDIDSYHSISVIETDLEVDFAPPVGYVEPTPSRAGTNPSSLDTPQPSGVSTPAGTMANAIGFDDLARSTLSAQQKKDPFSSGGQKLSGRTVTTKSSQAVENDQPSSELDLRNLVGLQQDVNHVPAPLRVPFGQLFFGYPIIPVKNTEDEKDGEGISNEPAGGASTFHGEGQSLRQNKKKRAPSRSNDNNEGKF
ncbi:UFD1-domain-containing protein [Nadsonia fulvescens var. elongata DSM 6958]|uniref:UFD1-domain-containing protein n=1 Tax=Nadsonia fulvescens var. elongata DSM 6958 TaxID=857566 RepID=A0A1E3PI59_9ASCO|nr:UFD1-domain-containing protein [Nadsonia fulvescens var. elongata DSM 6958]